MAETSTPKGTDLYTAQDAIRAMLAPEQDTANASDALEAENEVEVDEFEAEMSEEDYSEDELESEDEQDEGDEDQSFDLLSAKVEIDGEEITVEELKRGHLRQRDYTRKTQELAEIRKGFEAQQAEVLRERAQYETMLGQLRQRIEADVEQEPDWDKLYEADPSMAARAERQWRKQQDAKSARLQAINAEQQRLDGLRAQYREQLEAQYVEQQRAMLPEIIPEWRDASVASKEAAQLRQVLANEGFTEEDIGGLKNATLVKLARKAMLYDTGAKTANEAKAKPKQQGGAKVLKAGSRGSQPKPKSARIQAQQKAQQTGRLRDAAAAIKTLL